MRFFVGQTVVDLKHGRILEVLGVGGDMALGTGDVITDWVEVEMASTMGMGTSTTVVVRELSDRQLVNWNVWSRA